MIRFAHVREGAGEILQIHSVVRIDGQGPRGPFPGPLLLSQIDRDGRTEHHGSRVVGPQRDLFFNALQGAALGRDEFLVTA